jgi:hypothetical protein
MQHRFAALIAGALLLIAARAQACRSSCRRIC